MALSSLTLPKENAQVVAAVPGLLTALAGAVSTAGKVKDLSLLVSVFGVVSALAKNGDAGIVDRVAKTPSLLERILQVAELFGKGPSPMNDVAVRAFGLEALCLVCEWKEGLEVVRALPNVDKRVAACCRGAEEKREVQTRSRANYLLESIRGEPHKKAELVRVMGW